MPYLDESSPWLDLPASSTLFKSRTNIDLNAQNVSNLSRKIEHQFEVINHLKAYEWSKIVEYCEEFNLLYISGGVDLSTKETLDLIKSSNLIIIHEPYKINFSSFNPININYSGLNPRPQLYFEERTFVNVHAMGRRKIGLHIRRGDYKSWEGGKFFYDDNFWISMVEDFLAKDLSVWIFTNEDNPNFHGKLVRMGAHLSNSSFEKDFVRMFFMDDIYGPPSTFSVMATKIAKNSYGLSPTFHYLPPK